MIYLKKHVSHGDYQQTKGKGSQLIIPTGKIMGFRKYDKVFYLGKNYFIKGRMSLGYAVLMTITGDKLNLKPTPKFSKMFRVSSRKSCIMDTYNIN